LRVETDPPSTASSCRLASGFGTTHDGTLIESRREGELPVVLRTTVSIPPAPPTFGA
jgi:hypothetical protein